MKNYSNFDVYKVRCSKVKGYVFAVQEETEEEPIYHYYLISQESKQYPPLSKPTDIMSILQAEDGELIEINSDDEEFAVFLTIMESLLLKPLGNLTKNNLYSTITEKDLQLLKKTS